MSARTTRWLRRVEQIEETLNLDAALSIAEEEGEQKEAIEVAWLDASRRSHRTRDLLWLTLSIAGEVEPALERALLAAVSRMADRAHWYDDGGGSAFAGNVERDLRRIVRDYGRWKAHQKGVG